MAELKRKTLQVEENLPFEQREWRAARVLWILLLLTMMATGVGLFGNGPLSTARAGEPGAPLWVEYQRFARYGARVRLTVHARAEADGAVRVTIGRSLADAFQVDRITPSPGAGRVTGDGLEYRIDADPGSDTPVIFELQPVRRWLVRGSIQAGGDTVHLTHFIYP